MSDASIEALAAALDLQTVRVVRQIAERGSLTAAAEWLGYSQPAVSQQLRRFEDRTGIALVERVGRGIRLTESGRVLARHAQDVATALEAAAGELAELRGLRAGRVRLVAFPSASAVLTTTNTSVSGVPCGESGRSAESDATVWNSSTWGRIALTWRLWRWPIKGQRKTPG